MMNDSKDIFERKNDHLRINLNDDVRSGTTTGLNNFVLEHCALPEINLKEVTTQTSFLGFNLGFPLLISSMTGGTNEGRNINIRLAEAAQEFRIAMGLGSQRAALENEQVAASFNLRKYAPNIPIFANLGAVQLNYGVSVQDCQKLIDMAEADGFILHLNPLQEALQPEGDTNFSNLLMKIEQVCKAIDKPVIVKEVGWGISPVVAKKLVNAGVTAIDVAGAGGTSWSQVEMYRSKDEVHKRIAADFRDWGIPTVEAIRKNRILLPDFPIIASGGIQTGIEVAKCLALGADLCGMAGRLLVAAAISTEKTVEVLDELVQETRVAMFVCGAATIEQLKKVNIFEC